jgi:BASS family bile acid:Na+ symporter
MHLILAALAQIGRWGTQAFVLSVLVGLALPPLASLARPLLPWTVLAFLTIMFVRVDLSDLRRLFRRPGRIALAAIWLVCAPPILFGGVLALIGRSHLEPGLILGVALQAAGPALSSSPGIAMLLGLDPALILCAVLLTTAASAFTAPIVATLVAGAAVPLDVTTLLGRLSLLIGAAMALAAMIRFAIGASRLRRMAPSFDGLGVCFYVIFGVAAMDGVLAASWAAPLRSLTFLGMSVTLSLLGFVASAVLLRPLSPGDRLVTGYATGQRNMSILIGALGTATPDSTFLYFALSQLPIFFLPQLIRPLARRALAPNPAAVAPGRPAV